MQLHRLGEELAVTENPTVYWKIRRGKVLSCSYCKPHRVENYGRRARSDAYKNKR
jgi:hypothetical protein